MEEKIRKFILGIYSRQVKSLFNRELKEEKEYLNSFPEPKKNIERSFFQYKCQMKDLNCFLIFIQNIAAFFFIPVFIILNIKKSEEKFKNSNDIAAFLKNGVTESIVPQSLYKEHKKIISISANGKTMIDIKDLGFLFRECFAKYWQYPFFCIKILMKLARCSFIINQYQPRSIIVHNEFSYTSSFLTEYCSQKGVNYINVMHGEKLFNIRDSFFQFYRCYVWDEYYAKLFKQLRAEKSQFIIERPPSMELNLDGANKQNNWFCTYYLGSETKKDLLTLRKYLNQLSVQKNKINIRIHPRYSDKAIVAEVFKGFSIEKWDVNLVDSLKNSEYVISLYSTVLNQAYYAGKKVVIDDVSNVKKFSKLKELNYIMLEKDIIKLSELLGRGKNL